MQTVTVSNGASQTVNFKLQRGIPVTAIVHDPKAVLVDSTTSKPLMSLVDSGGAFRTALQPHRLPDGTIRYSAYVPIGTVYRLAIQPNGITLASSTAGVVATEGTSVIAASAAAQKAFTVGAREIIIGELTVK